MMSPEAVPSEGDAARVAARLGVGVRVRARAFLIGNRLDLSAFRGSEQRVPTPLVQPCGDRGLVVMFRYGAVVAINLSDGEETGFLDRVRPFAHEPLASAEREDAWILIDAAEAEGIAPDGDVRLRAATLERLLVVADVLAKSTVLAFHEQRVAEVFDHVEPIAEDLRLSGARRSLPMRQLLSHIGEVLTTQHRMVGRAEVTEKPDFLWDHPGLDRLYARLYDEYDLSERDRALTRKLEVIAQTASTVADLVQARRSLRVEWYIVILIVIEIVMTLHEKLF